VVKLLGFVRCAPEFTEQPAVIDGCSQVLVEVVGEAGRGARAAVGVADLPFGIPAEIEAVVQVRTEETT
jgi:enamine deaminase RidA (YjgF/YER057c/UK114 family)